jgi:MinD-like ATPase involved in chromosome partitioning or flagellar assembly
VVKKEAKKILKYKELEKEIQRIQNVKTKVIPVIIRITSTISKSFTQYLICIYEIPSNFRKHPYLELCTYFGTYIVKVQKVCHGK